MSSLSPLQTLPRHAIEMIVDHFADNIRLVCNLYYYNGHSDECFWLQMPLLWVCRNFRAVVYSRLFKCYMLKIDKNADRAVRKTFTLPYSLEQLNRPFSLVAKEVMISMSPLTVYSGKAVTALSHEPYNDCPFPLARTLEVCFNSGDDSKDVTVIPMDAEVNISAFVRRIQQMTPRLNMVKLSGGPSPRKRADAASIYFDSLTTQLVQLVDQVELTHDCGRAFRFLRVDLIHSLTRLVSNFDVGNGQIIQLIRQSAPTLQHLSISSRVITNLSGIIQDNDGCYLEYPYLHTLVARLYTSWDMPRQYTFDGAAPFPSLRRLGCGGTYPFGDDLLLFRGSAATLELLQLTLTRELAVALLQRNVFTPTSHPKLQCVMLKLPAGMSSANYAKDPEILRLMLNISPNAAVRGVSGWYLDKASHPPVLSLLSKHTYLQVLALPDLRLSLWDAMTLIKSLPLLSDLHAMAPTLDPMPAGISKRKLIAYVSSNYSPMATRFRCWHMRFKGEEYSEDGVVPLLLLALACPNFDYVAVHGNNRQAFAELLETATNKATYKRYAPRLRRLLYRRSE